MGVSLYQSLTKTLAFLSRVVLLVDVAIRCLVLITHQNILNKLTVKKLVIRVIFENLYINILTLNHIK